jgi:MFS family permease
MLQRLFVTCGFGWGVRISGFLSLLLCSLACFLVSSRLERRPTSGPWFDTKHFHDVRFGLLIIGSVFLSLGAFSRALCCAQLTERPFSAGLFIPNFYIVSFAIDHAVSPDTAFYVLAVLNAGGILGRVMPAVLSDVLGRFNILVPSAALAGLSTLLVWTFARSLPAIMAYAALYGFFSGAFNALIVPCIAQISGIREIGLRIGMLYSILSFPCVAQAPFPAVYR